MLDSVSLNLLTGEAISCERSRHVSRCWLAHWLLDNNRLDSAVLVRLCVGLFEDRSVGSMLTLHELFEGLSYIRLR